MNPPRHIHPLTIAGAFIIEPEVHRDHRGFLYEVWKDETIAQLGDQSSRILQVNRSRSARGVLRGLHYQINASAQAKLVTVLSWSNLRIASGRPQVRMT